jgi:Na+/H+ antiporter NhaC
MHAYLGYIIIISFIISITVITSLGITAEVSNNHTSFNETSITMINKTHPKNSSSETCVMPKCPSENVCIQVCPESLPPV